MLCISHSLHTKISYPMKQRLIHIDIAKAIGLIIIMTSHINVHPSLREMTSMKLYQDIIHSFYVPLFFILSGIFLKPPQYKLFSINSHCFFVAFFNSLNIFLFPPCMHFYHFFLQFVNIIIHIFTNISHF